MFIQGHQQCVFPVWDLRMNKRKLIQIFSTILHNAYPGFIFTNTIYTGFFKRFCCPGLNCYSCPASLFACPLGVLQNTLASIRILSTEMLIGIISYVTGFFFLFGFFFGRFVCGWLCPFGLFQELIYKIPFIIKKRITLPFNFQRYIKYLILIVFVFFFPLFVLNDLGYGTVGFCKYLCPAGIIEAGYLNLLINKSLRSLIGITFYIKTTIFLFIILLCIVDLRFFCKNLCPLGVIYGFFNRFSFLRLSFDATRCSSCKICESVCPVNLSVSEELNSVECIRCLNCMSVCPTKAIILFSEKNHELSRNKAK